MSQDKEREAFEAWAKTRGYNTRLSEYGHYPSLLTALTHEGWQARTALASQPPAVQGEPVKRVFIVATGELHEGEETYTRYDNKPPPLCDAECLYTTSPPSREPLTEAAVRKLILASEVYEYHSGAILEFARAIERAHGIHSREGGSNG